MRGRRTPPRESRLGTFFLLLGCSTVLAGAFTAGIFSGRHWPALWPSVGAVRGSAKGAPGQPPVGRAAADTPGARPLTSPPVLTFYQELTAPLTATAPPPKLRPGERPSRRDDAAVEVPAPADDGDKAAVARPAASPGARRFTVQAGAFRTREQAEALKNRLAAAGHAAYITEAGAGPGARYRVRAGAFSSRDAADRAAERVTAALNLPTYVTVR